VASLLRTIATRIDDDVALRLTLIVLLLRPGGDDWLRAATWILAIAALVWAPLLRSRAVWLALAVATALRVVREWPLPDNHLYLLTYWCLAVGLSLTTPDPECTRRRSTRWLVGAAFACAVAWKVLLAPDFLDARFFRVTLLTDDRFTALARAVGGLSASELDDDRQVLTPLPPGVEVIDGPVLVEPPLLRGLARALTWGGVGLEALVAVAFLAAWPRWLRATRHALLITFCAVTYAIAPVAGFGWLLAAMGLAHTTSAEWRARLGYVAVFLLVLLYAEAHLVRVLLEWHLT